jgi:hypothetical protein
MSDAPPSAPQTAATQTSATSPTPEPKRKPGRVIGVLIFLWAFWMGWHGWENYSSSKAESKRAEWEDKTIAPRMTVLRQKLEEIESRPTKTVDDYIANTLEISPIVDEAKGLDQRRMELIRRFKEAYKDNPSDLRMADYMARLSQTDDRLISLLGEEVDRAKAMKDLPASKRLDYYNANIPTIKDKEAQVMKDWLAIAKDAKEKGIPLPGYVQQAIPKTDSSN